MQGVAKRPTFVCHIRDYISLTRNNEKKREKERKKNLFNLKPRLSSPANRNERKRYTAGRIDEKVGKNESL